MTALVASLLIVAAPAAHPTNEHQPLSALTVWDDGLAEMSYYAAVDTIYGKKRKYTRVQLVNRQWMDAQTGVKTAPDDPKAVPVFKFNVAEEIPTESYNYRYLTTTFVRRPDLAPFKVAASSQEWCGTTFKHLRWMPDGLHYKSFSYFGDEGDKEWQLPAEVVPADALYLIARDVVARGEPQRLRVLASVRSTHEVDPRIFDARLVPAARGMKKSTAIGQLLVRRVEVDWDGPKAFFEVEEAPPHRLVRFRYDTIEGTIQFVERRAYWDRNWSSGFHEPNEAP